MLPFIMPYQRKRSQHTLCSTELNRIELHLSNTRQYYFIAKFPINKPSELLEKVFVSIHPHFICSDSLAKYILHKQENK